MSIINTSDRRQIFDATGSVTLNWKHRARLNTTIKPQIDSTDTLDEGVTYTLKIYGEVNQLLRTETGLTGTSYEYVASDELADSGSDVLQASLRFEIESTNGTLTSLFKAVKILVR